MKIFNIAAGDHCGHHEDMWISCGINICLLHSVSETVAVAITAVQRESIVYWKYEVISIWFLTARLPLILCLPKTALPS